MLQPAFWLFKLVRPWISTRVLAAHSAVLLASLPPSLPPRTSPHGADSAKAGRPTRRAPRRPLRAESRQEREAATCSPCPASAETRAPGHPATLCPDSSPTDTVRQVGSHAAQGRPRRGRRGGDLRSEGALWTLWGEGFPQSGRALGEPASVRRVPAPSQQVTRGPGEALRRHTVALTWDRHPRTGRLFGLLPSLGERRFPRPEGRSPRVCGACCANRTAPGGGPQRPGQQPHGSPLKRDWLATALLRGHQAPLIP